MRFVLSAAALAAALPAHAAVVDDFNRANGPGLGANYTVQNGNFSISNGQAITTNFVSLATFNDSASSTAGLDVGLRGQDSGSYVALSFGWGSDHSYFIKVQDNDGDGWFDRYGFDTGNNELSGPFTSLGSYFQTASIDVSIEGTVATLKILANGATQTYSYDYGFAPGSNLVGFGINRLGTADNLRFDAAPMAGVPEPATWALLLGGFGLVGTAMRSRQRRSVVIA